MFTHSKSWVWFSFLKLPLQNSAFFIRILSFFIGYHLSCIFSQFLLWTLLLLQWQMVMKRRCRRSLTLYFYCVFSLYELISFNLVLCIIWSLSYFDTTVCFVMKFDVGFFLLFYGFHLIWILWLYYIWFGYYNYVFLIIILV